MDYFKYVKLCRKDYSTSKAFKLTKEFLHKSVCWQVSRFAQYISFYFLRAPKCRSTGWVTRVSHSHVHTKKHFLRNCSMFQSEQGMKWHSRKRWIVNHRTFLESSRTSIVEGAAGPLSLQHEAFPRAVSVTTGGLHPWAPVGVHVCHLRNVLQHMYVHMKRG